MGGWREEPRWRRYLRLWGPDVDADVDDELRFHLEMRERDFVEAGMSEAEAREAARSRFGDVGEVRMWLRDHDRRKMRRRERTELMDELIQDVRYAIRKLGQQPGFTAATMIVLALGIGATTAIFSAVDAVLLRPLPFTDAERLVRVDRIYIPHRRENDGGHPKGAPDIGDARTLDVFTQVAAYAPGGMNLTGAGTPRRVRVGVVTPNLFATLGVAPALGRTFSPEEGEPDGPRVAILSESVWRAHFGADPDVLGRSVELNGNPHEIVGVMRRGFAFPEETELWLPMSVPTTSATMEPFRQYMPSAVIARLAPGVTQVMAGEAVRVLLMQYESADRPVKATAVELVQPLRARLVGDRRAALLVLLGATALVLLVACANVANLLLSRASVRRREIALRAVLGATPGRVMRQLLVESVILALAGAALGLVVAYAGVQVLDVLVPSALSGVAPVRIDGRVLGFALALALGTGVAFGLWPAIGARRTDAAEALKAGGVGAGTSGESARLRRAFVVGELALALMLLVGSALMLRSFQALLATDAGVRPERVATLELTLAQAQYGTRAERRQFYERVLERLAANPEIEAAAAVNELPLRGQGGIRFLVYPEGRPPEEMDLRYAAQDLRITPDYFRAMGIRVLEGRAPRPRSDSLAVSEVAINEMLAGIHWPGESPIGERLEMPGGAKFEVVGVVADVRPTSLESETYGQAYYSLLDTPYDNAAIVVRGRVPARALTGWLQAAVREVAPAQAVYNVKTMEEVIAGTITPRRTNTLLITVFGVLAVVLAAVGVYGVIAYSVARRTREIGIRMALGARPGRVMREVFGEGLVLALVGTTLGLAGAWMLSRVLSGLVYGVSLRDPVSFVAAPLILITVAATATLVPARRATRVDPVDAIRVE